jgi:tRNA-specific 2-thiouridylase
MDMKQKLEEAYIPDRQTRKERVLIALSGGIDSYVMAYLLKIQKYDLVAVTIVNFWEDYAGEHEKILACHIGQSKMDEIKDFCHKMGISHYFIKSLGDFKEKVVEPWIGDKILGKFPRPCWNCHEHRMQLLYEKMKELGVPRMATGHFAKLFHNDTHGTVFVHSSNDEQHDQSAFLSRLPHDILNSLVLPLSDLSKKEVLKLAENFGLTQDAKKLEIHQCLKDNPELLAQLEKKVPPKYLKEGDVSNSDNNEVFGQHTGIQHHTLGEEYEYREAGKPVKGIFGHFSYQDKRMVVFEPDQLKRNRLLLTKCHLSEEVHWIEPIKGFMALSAEIVIECWIYPKTLSSVYIELSENHVIHNGQVITIFKKKGKNSKVYLTGEIQLLPNEPEPVEGEASVPKANYAVDF